jgi:pimeloyl-ACP methyl ester carboxylesterase
VQLATLRQAIHYWQTDYNWRKIEVRLNAPPQFLTEIDGLDIHFVHIRSKHENAANVTHGWPGSIIEQLEIIDPLTDPTNFGGGVADAFHLVIPSMPGYGFSGKPTTTGWDPAHIARAWVMLMKRLGYQRFVAQGGDWGGHIANVMAQQAPPERLRVPRVSSIVGGNKWLRKFLGPSIGDYKGRIRVSALVLDIEIRGFWTGPRHARDNYVMHM